MRKYVIFTDSSCDLSLEERKAIGIWPTVFPQDIIFNDGVINVDDPEDFYRRQETGEYAPGSLKTSSGSPDDVARILDDIIENCDKDTVIVYAGISPCMSESTANVVGSVLNEYAEKTGRRFVNIDTQSISNGLATFLQYLAQYDGDDIEDYGQKLGKHIVHLFTENDLSYSARSGRYNCIEQAATTVMGALKLSPWLYFPGNNRLSMRKPCRRGRILGEWADYYAKNVAPDNQFVRIGYGGEESRKMAEELAQRLEKKGVNREQIQFAHVGPLIGVHTGPTVLSFFFKQKGERFKQK